MTHMSVQYAVRLMVRQKFRPFLVKPSVEVLTVGALPVGWNLVLYVQEEKAVRYRSENCVCFGLI